MAITPEPPKCSGHPIGDIGRDQRQRDFDLRIARPVPRPQAEPADRGAEQHLAGDDGEEGAAGFRQRKHSGRNRHHREAVQDQRGGVVGEPFAFEDDENTARQPEPAGDRQRRHHVRRRDDGAEQEADIPRQPDQIMRRGGDREGGEDHAADRQQDDRAQIGFELAPAHGDAGRIDQRRQHHQQHQFRRQFQRRHARHEGQHDAAQQQQDRRRDVDAPRQQRGARQHRQQNQKNLELGFHGPRCAIHSESTRRRVSGMPDVITSKTRPCRRPACRTIGTPRRPGRYSNDG